jgi:hypothetical protein
VTWLDQAGCAGADHRVDAVVEAGLVDRQRFNKELLALYEEEGMDPAASCLPILRRPLRQGLHDRLARTIVVQANDNGPSSRVLSELAS